jgi:cyclic pyranopterin phosphate synthase
MSALIDPFARPITYLRVSVTDRCDLRCVYCMAEDMTFLPKREILSLEELEILCGAFIDRGVRRLRITGGEPLVRRGVLTLFDALGAHHAVGAAERGAGRAACSPAGRARGENQRGGVARRE